MECRDICRTLPALMDGDLRPGPEAEVHRHLETCPGCLAEWEALRADMALADAALAYRGVPLSFDGLRARMAAIEPLEEVLRYRLPKLKIPGTAPRFVAAMGLLVLLAGVPYALRHTRQVYTSVKTPFAQQEETLAAALDEGRFPWDEAPAEPDTDISTGKHA